MKKGEVSVITCAPEFGYGASGSPPKIPPNSWLKFEVCQFLILFLIISCTLHIFLIIL